MKCTLNAWCYYSYNIVVHCGVVDWGEYNSDFGTMYLVIPCMALYCSTTNIICMDLVFLGAFDRCQNIMYDDRKVLPQSKTVY